MSENRELTISSITDLQIALMEDNNPAIKTYIEHIDRETANRAMEQAGEHFGFPTVEIEGVLRTSSGHIARVFGYKRPHAVLELLKRWDIDGVKLAGYTYDTCIKITEKLGLEANDRRSTLYDWPAFLIGGMNSTNEEARAVQLYLLRAERVARIGVVAVRQGQLQADFPDPAHGAAMTKLANLAWRGNSIAAHILETHYNVPVTKLLHQSDPELSTEANTIAQFLHLLVQDKTLEHNLRITKTETGYRISGQIREFALAFYEAARKHRIKPFFENNFSCGRILSRERDALFMLGWNSESKKSGGNTKYIFQYEPPSRLIEN